MKQQQNKFKKISKIKLQICTPEQQQQFIEQKQKEMQDKQKELINPIRNSIEEQVKAVADSEILMLFGLKTMYYMVDRISLKMF